MIASKNCPQKVLGSRGRAWYDISMNENEILESALADALADQLAIRLTITMLIDRGLRETLIYRAAIHEFKVISLEIRTLRDMI